MFYGKDKKRNLFCGFFIGRHFVSIDITTIRLSARFFYFSIYFSLLGLFLEHRQIVWRHLKITWPVFALGLIYIAWYLWFEYPHNGLNFKEGYLNSGKKIVLAGFLVLYLSQFSHYLVSTRRQSLLLAILGIGFVAASCYGVWQSQHGMARVQMAIDRATITAYIYSTLSLTIIYLLYLQKNSVIMFWRPLSPRRLTVF